MEPLESSVQHPLYFKVVLLSDCVNESRDISAALLDWLPYFSKRRGEYDQHDIRNAQRMTELANAYGWHVVFESKNEKEAFQIQCNLRRCGIRILPFGHPLPSTPNQASECGLPLKLGFPRQENLGEKPL